MSEPHVLGRDPEPDIITEATRLLDVAREAGVPVRLIGGVAIRLHIGTDVEPVMKRDYNDIDLATLSGKSKQISAFMTGAGYHPDREFNTLHGHRRLLFFDTANRRQVDVFVGQFAMCHEIPITERMMLVEYGIPLAELFLTKMQIVQLTKKDQIDLLTMLYHHNVAEDDDGHINSARVAELCAADWGLWRTTRGNIERLKGSLENGVLDESGNALVAERLDRLWQRIEDEPKTGRWKRRSRIGEKKRWYQEPEEVS